MKSRFSCYDALVSKQSFHYTEATAHVDPNKDAVHCSDDSPVVDVDRQMKHYKAIE